MHSQPPRAPRQSGFSLIEIMIAMVVSLIGLAGLMSLYVTTSKSNQRATNLVVASTVAQQTMEELRSMPLFPPMVGPLVGKAPTARLVQCHL